MEYSWRKDPENPIRVDENGIMTIVVEELIDGLPQKPKVIQTADVPANLGTTAEIWAEAKKQLKTKLAPRTDRRRKQAAARIAITDEMVADLETYLTTEEV